MRKRTVGILIAVSALMSCQSEFPSAPAVRPDENAGGGDGQEEVVAADVTVTVDLKSDLGRISNMLTGVNLLYCFEKDALWAGDSEHKCISYLKRMKCGVLRYPGGKILEAWHWDNPNGQFAADRWNPKYQESDSKSPSEYMDLDEYMAVVRELDAEPLVGVNITSGIKWRNDVEPSVDETRRLVRHCLDKGYQVKYWYIGNEPYHNGSALQFSPEQYGEAINRFAKEIHEVDPKARIVANWDRNVTSSSMGRLLAKAGKNIDVMEIHWYWSWGTASWDLWKDQIPMAAGNQFYANGKSHFEEVRKFRHFASKIGCSHIKLASLEWNIGPGKDMQPAPDGYQMALMQSEMLMQFMEGGLCMAAFWPLHYGASDDGRYMLDATHDYQPRHTIDVFAMLGALQGGTMLERSSTSKEMYSIISKGDDGKIRVALLNKNSSDRTCALYFKEDFSDKNVSVQCYSEAGEKGKAVISDDLKHVCDKGRMIFELPSYSLTVVTLG